MRCVDLALNMCTGELSFPRIICLLQCMLLVPFLGMRCLWMCRFIFRCLALSMVNVSVWMSGLCCPCHQKFCGMVMPLVLLFLLGEVLAIWDLLCFQMNFSSVFSTPMKNVVGVFMRNAKKCWFLLVIWPNLLLLLLLFHECEMSLCLLVFSFHCKNCLLPWSGLFLGLGRVLLTGFNLFNSYKNLLISAHM